MPSATSSASSRRRVGLRPGPSLGASRSTIRLALAPSSPCPHCGRTTKTVQGVCADCWGSKGARQFWVRRYQGPDSLLEEFLGLSTGWIVAFAALLAAVPALLIAISWIWG